MKFFSDGKNQLKRFVSLMIAMILVIPIFTYCMDSSIVSAMHKENDDFEIEAKSAILYCKNTDSVIYKKNINDKMSPYSVTKLLTALIVVEKEKNLNRKVKISKKAAETGGSTMYLKEGEVVTLKELLNGLLIVSGNDAAYALAETVGHGDEKAFVKMMNERVEKLGCEDTHFINSSGITDKKHYTTAKDYLIITRAALDNKTVKKIAGTKKYNMPATNKSEKRTLKTHTDLLNTKNSGVISGKTGFDGVKEGTVSLEYDKDDLHLILVILGDDQEVRPKDAKKIFAHAKDWLKVKKTVKKNERLTKVFVRGGKSTVVNAYAKRTVYAYMKKKDDVKIKTRIVKTKNLKAPLNSGSRVGTVKVYVNGNYSAESPLIVKKSIKKGWFPSLIYISNRATIGIVIAFVLCLLLSAAIKLKKTKSENKSIGKHDAGR